MRAELTDPEGIHPAIAALYQASSGIDLREFRYQALSILNRVLPFRSACWGLVPPAGSILHRCAARGGGAPILEALVDRVPLWMAQGRSDRHGDLHRVTVDPDAVAAAGAEAPLQLLWRRAATHKIFLLTSGGGAAADPAGGLEDASALLFHVSAAYSQALIRTVSLQMDRRSAARYGVAVLDRDGFVFEASAAFWMIAGHRWPVSADGRLEAALVADGQRHISKADGLSYVCRLVDDWLALRVWTNGPLDVLTDRELEIVYRVCRGLTYKQAALELRLSPSTVSNRLYRIYDKLAIRGKPELIKLVDRSNVGS